MPPTLSVRFDASQFPQQVRLDLVASLRARRLRHKFHYDSVKQTQQWLALHQALSPSRQDPGCAEAYARSFAAAARAVPPGSVHLVGLGCGGGQKDTELLKHLGESDRALRYTPVDVSAAMVMVATERSQTVVPPDRCHPVVVDLETAVDLKGLLFAGTDPDEVRVLTFFGMLPNFEVGAVVPRLAALVRPQDQLLVSANLAPGGDYEAGLRAVLPQYDHPLLRAWLMTALTDVGFEMGDGTLRFEIEWAETELGLRRIVAWFDVERERVVTIDGENLRFAPGEAVRLFYSNRFTTAQTKALLTRAGLEVHGEHASPSGEEAVFLCRRHPSVLRPP